MVSDKFLKELEEIEKLPLEEQITIYEDKLRADKNKSEAKIYLYFNYGHHVYQSGDFRKTIAVLEPVLMDYQSYPFTVKMISCFNLLGLATHCETDYSVSRYYYSIGLKLAKEHDEKFYFSYEYNNMALSYIAQKRYREALEYIHLAEENLKYSDDRIAAFIYINKTFLHIRMNELQEAREIYDIAVNKYNAMNVLEDDVLLCGAALYFKLGEMEEYNRLKQQILGKMDAMYTAEYMDACKELFECGLESDDFELVNRILQSMDMYMLNHPKEIRVGITVAELKYAYARKLNDKDGILKALELKNYYKDFILQHSEEKRIKSLREALDINAQLLEAIASKEQAAIAKSQFLANMSHDIRTPINGIVGMLNIIRRSEEDPERVADCLDKIESSSGLLLSLVNDVLDMAKLETTSIILDDESVNLQDLCYEISEGVVFQAEAAGITVEEEHDDYDGIYVWTSSLHIKKILINLFTNSIKYNKPGGIIRTSMHTLETTEEQIVCEFTIEDTGIGMTQDFIDNKLFEPFLQAKKSSRSSYMGTGLGMSIVKQIIDKMGGSITVESKLGEGSRFIVVLPFKLDNKHQHEEKTAAQKADISGLNILVAEDNELNMEIAQFLLEDNGAKVVPAQNGAEALEIFNKSEEGTFDAILMDIMMPIMDGLTATREIRMLPRLDSKRIPIVAMTANAFKEDEEKCLKAGMDAHLAKPVDIDKLKMTLASLIK